MHKICFEYIGTQISANLYGGVGGGSCHGSLYCARNALKSLGSYVNSELKSECYIATLCEENTPHSTTTKK